jgi:plasmid stability protein
MAQMIVRGIEQAVVDALKRRAAARGVSAEAEHREIRRRALVGGSRRSLKEHLLAMPDGATDADFDVPRPRARRVRL